MIVYDNLWKVMKEKGVTQYSLIKKYGISPAQITRLKRNESVSTHTIDIFCKILHCNVTLHYGIYRRNRNKKGQINALEQAFICPFCCEVYWCSASQRSAI